MSGIYDFPIEQGVAFQKTITWNVLSDPLNPDSTRVAVDMTGMVYRSELRSRDGVLIAVLADDVAGASTGAIVLQLTDAQTEALDFDTAVYDLEISQGGQVIKRLLKGQVTLDREVTEEE